MSLRKNSILVLYWSSLGFSIQRKHENSNKISTKEFDFSKSVSPEKTNKRNPLWVTGFLFFSYFTQIQFSNALDGVTPSLSSHSSQIDKDSCFRGYVEKNQLNESRIFQCLCLILERKDGSECEGTSNRESIEEDIRTLLNSEQAKDHNTGEAIEKAKDIFYDDCYCPRKGNKGKLPFGICHNLGVIITSKSLETVDDLRANNENRKACKEKEDGGEIENCFETDEDKLSLCEEKKPVGLDNNENSFSPENENTNSGEVANSNKKETEIVDATGEGEKTGTEVVKPFQDADSDNSPINPIGGRSFGQPVDPSSSSMGKFSAFSPSGGTISSSRARVPGARVGDPGDITIDGGGKFASRPRGLLPLRGEPGGTPNNNGSTGGPSATPGGGGPPGSAGIGGATGGGGRSASKARRRRRRGSTSGSGTRYMGSPGAGGQGGRGYSPRSSSMNRLVRKKMEENKNKPNAKSINALFQRELRRRGKTGPQSFTPVFYFPDIQRTYEEMNSQNQFLNEKGTEL